MGIDGTCKVVGLGTMKIKMWGGVTCTLSDLKHVLSLKKNLISLSTFD